jgi:hypothetical protein
MRFKTTLLTTILACCLLPDITVAQGYAWRWVGRFIWDDGEATPYHRHLMARKSFDLSAAGRAAQFKIMASDKYLLWASPGIGTLRNIVFENLVFNRPGSIQVHANTDGLTVRDVKLLFSPPADYHLIELGPKSMTYKHGGESSDPVRWVEVFSPDRDCTVRNVSVTGVRLRDSQTDLPIEQVVKVIEQKPNPDYPKTTPRRSSCRTSSPPGPR